MFESTAELGKSLISGIWRMFQIYVPGFSFTFGQMWIGVALCSLSLWLIKFLFGFAGGGSSPRTGSTNNPKISDKRRKDEF